MGPYIDIYARTLTKGEIQVASPKDTNKLTRVGTTLASGEHLTTWGTGLVFKKYLTLWKAALA